MIRSKLSQSLSSPVLFVFFLFISVALAARVRSIQADSLPPRINGFDWEKHPDALLVVYPLADYCSTCNLSVSDWAGLGLKQGMDVLVVAARPTKDISELKKKYRGETGLFVVTGVNETIIRRFSSGDKIGGVRVRSGHLVARQLGGTPSQYFLQGR